MDSISTCAKLFQFWAAIKTYRFMKLVDLQYLGISKEISHRFHPPTPKCSKVPRIFPFCPGKIEVFRFFHVGFQPRIMRKNASTNIFCSTTLLFFGLKMVGWPKKQIIRKSPKSCGFHCQMRSDQNRVGWVRGLCFYYPVIFRDYVFHKPSIQDPFIN